MNAKHPPENLDGALTRINDLEQSLVATQGENKLLSTKVRNLAKEQEMMLKAQGDLFRFQEKIEQQKNIYAQIAKIGHKFNETLDFLDIVNAVQRFSIDLLNYEVAILFLWDAKSSQLVCQSVEGNYDDARAQKIKNATFELNNPVLAPFQQSSATQVCTATGDTSFFNEFKEIFDLNEFYLFSLGRKGSILTGFLVIGNSPRHLNIHRRIEVDEEMDALLSNVTSLIAGGITTVKFLQAIQDETEQVKSLLNNMRQAVFSVSADGTVVNPVSQFAENLFGIDIAGKKVFDTLYKDIPRNSETFSALDGVFLTVYGESEMQWELAIDNFPNRVMYVPPASAQGNSEVQPKVLRISSGPIWNKAGLLDKIMFVVDDITLVEKLELQVSKNRAELEIIQHLSSNTAEANQDFFMRSPLLTRECRTLIVGVRESDEAFGILMRNLHTLKGNARLLGLGTISQMIHDLETAVLDGKPRVLDRTQSILQFQGKALTMLHGVEDQMQLYCRVGKRVLNLKTSYEKGLLEDLIALADEIESSYSKQVHDTASGERTFLNMVSLTKKLRALQIPSLDDLLSVHEQAMNELFESPDPMAKIREWGQPIFEPFSRAILNYFFNSESFSPYTLSSASLAELTSRLIRLNMKAIESKASLDHNTPEIIDLHRHLRAHGFLYLGRLFQEKVSASDWQAVWNYYSLMILTKDRFGNKKTQPLLPELKGFFQALSDTSKSRSHTQNVEGLSALILAKFTQQELSSQAFQEVAKQMGKALKLEEAKSHMGTHEISANLLKYSPLKNEIDQADSDPYFSKLANFILAKEGQSSASKFLKTADALLLVSAFDENLISKKSRQSGRTIEVSEEKFEFLANFIANASKDTSGSAMNEIKSIFGRLLDTPIKPMFFRFENMVSEVSMNLHKKVSYKVRGEDIAISRDLLEPLQNIAVHILRNSIDHGIEDQETRSQLKKSEYGLLEVECRILDADHVQIKFCDDGRGLDPKHLSEIAVKKGVITRAQAQAMSDDERINLIFLPGFSSKAEANELSGRGVGMDVVKKLAEQIGATITIETKIHQGTAFIIQIKR